MPYGWLFWTVAVLGAAKESVVVGETYIFFCLLLVWSLSADQGRSLLLPVGAYHSSFSLPGLEVAAPLSCDYRVGVRTSRCTKTGDNNEVYTSYY